MFSTALPAPVQRARQSLRERLFHWKMRLLGWRPIKTAPQDDTLILLMELRPDYGAFCWLGRRLNHRAAGSPDHRYKGWWAAYPAIYFGGPEPEVSIKPIILSPRYWKPRPKPRTPWDGGE